MVGFKLVAGCFSQRFNFFKPKLPADAFGTNFGNAPEQIRNFFKKVFWIVLLLIPSCVNTDSLPPKPAEPLHKGNQSLQSQDNGLSGDALEVSSIRKGALPDNIETQLVNLPPAAAGNTQELNLTVTPLFHSVALLVESNLLSLSSDTTTTVRYKKTNETEWRFAFPLRWDPVYEKLAGSIVRLEEAEEYVVEVSVNDSESNRSFSVQDHFTTWSEPPVDPDKIYHLKDIYHGGVLDLVSLNIHGTEEGWARIVGDKNTLISVSDDQEAAIRIGSQSYILFENIKIDSGGRHGITSFKAHHLWFRNLEISKWGRSGTTINGLLYESRKAGQLIDKDAAFFLDASGIIVVERSVVRDPRTGSNTWEHGHPRGGTAFLSSTYHPDPRYRGQIVLRYNDFFAADRHRFNDVIESHSNGKRTGGFHKNSDIYGNYLAFANDDLLELDGGQINVRVFGNRLEAGYNGISLAPNMRGPSYIFRNLIHNLNDERGKAWSAFKTGGLAVKPEGETLIFHNTVHGPSNGIYGTRFMEDRSFRATTRNNIFVSTADWWQLQFGIRDLVQAPGSSFDYDLIYSTVSGHGIREIYSGAVANGLIESAPEFIAPDSADFSLHATSPAIDRAVKISNFNDRDTLPDIGAFERDTIPIRLPDRPGQIGVNKNQVNLVYSTSAILQTSVTLTNFGETIAPYRIIKSDYADWFSVTPATGYIPGNGIIELQISGNQRADIINRQGVFIIKLENGVSLPVSVQTRSDS